jgi:hypothetical protein
MVNVDESTQKRDVWRWYWVVTFFFILAALIGWAPAYRVVILISFLQLAHSMFVNGSVASFPVQIRMVYFGVTLLGLVEAARFPVFLLLLAGTFMVAFLGRCRIALVLKRMPWNAERELRLN